MAFALCAPFANAIPLDFSVSGVGHYNPASAFNNDSEVTTAVNKLVNWYNGGANPNPDPDATFALAPGSGLPPPLLPASLVFGFKDEQGPFVDINSGQYSYALGKYGNTAYLFYLGNLAPGSYSLPGTMGGNALSHEVAFTSSPGNRVPDGGASIGVLGLTLLLVEVVRRRLKLA